MSKYIVADDLKMELIGWGESDRTCGSRYESSSGALRLLQEF